VASGDGYLSISNLQRDAYGYYSYHVDVEPKEHIIYFGEERIKEVRASGDVYTSEYEPGEIEITWDTAYADKVFYQIFGGAYYDDATLVGIIGEIILSLTPMDVVCDFRDMCAYITKICKGQHSLENYGMAFVCFASIFVITADAFSIWKKVKKLNQTEVNILMASTKLDGITEESIETGIKHAGEVLEGGSGNIKYNEIKIFTAEETNQWFIDNIKPDYKPPYKPGTVVKEIELLEDTTFVRVYDKMPDGSGMYGSWVMKAEDIEGLTPLEIQNKFALPNTPRYICDVELDAGTHIRLGEVNSVDGWGNGGGIQYDLIGQRIGEFGNERLLEGN